MVCDGFLLKKQVISLVSVVYSELLKITQVLIHYVQCIAIVKILIYLCLDFPQKPKCIQLTFNGCVLMTDVMRSFLKT